MGTEKVRDIEFSLMVIISNFFLMSSILLKIRDINFRKLT